MNGLFYSFTSLTDPAHRPIPDLNRRDGFGRGLAVEVDPRDRGMRAFENDVLGLLHVQVRGAQPIEDVRQHAGLVAMPHDEHVRRRRLLGEVDDVRHAAGLEKRPDDAHGFRGDGFLRLIGGRADVMRADDVRQRQDRIVERALRPPTVRWQRRRARRADPFSLIASRQRGVVEHLGARGVDQHRAGRWRAAAGRHRRSRACPWSARDGC